MKKLLFIMNPNAGQRRANKVLPEILQVFNRGGYETTVFITSAQGEAEKAVQQQGAHVDLIVCCGGDGTMNETITGMLNAGLDIPIGYIPAGTTNDFASSLKLSHNAVQAAQDIVDGQPVAYDVGRFGERYFCYVASFGAFTKSSYIVSQDIKNALGHTAYVLGGIQELSQIRKEHVRMELDGEVVEDDFLFGAICNSTSIGGILTLDPRRVDMSDGVFEILLVRAPQNLTELTECITAMQKQTYNCAAITFRSASRVKISAGPDMAWTLDGEKEEGHAQVEAVNLHRAVRLMQRVDAHA